VTSPHLPRPSLVHARTTEHVATHGTLEGSRDSAEGVRHRACVHAALHEGLGKGAPALDVFEGRAAVIIGVGVACHLIGQSRYGRNQTRLGVRYWQRPPLSLHFLFNDKAQYQKRYWPNSYPNSQPLGMSFLKDRSQCRIGNTAKNWPHEFQFWPEVPKQPRKRDGNNPQPKQNLR
jgi:hypothetical protein